MPRILIIEDDYYTREVLREYLQKKGYRVVSTGDGFEGMTLHFKEPFDLIIMDLFLPDTEGTEILLKLRQKSNPKIIAISDLLGHFETAKKMGAHRSFAMPFEVSEVGKAAAELLRR
jgi:two-component system response regulator AdeR